VAHDRLVVDLVVALVVAGESSRARDRPKVSEADFASNSPSLGGAVR
jgi:hypothetical protein